MVECFSRPGHGLTFRKSGASRGNKSRNYEIRNSKRIYIQENKFFMILSAVERNFYVWSFPKIEMGKYGSRVSHKQDMANKQIWYSHPHPGFLRQQTRKISASPQTQNIDVTDGELEKIWISLIRKPFCQLHIKIKLKFFWNQHFQNIRYTNAMIYL